MPGIKQRGISLFQGMFALAVMSIMALFTAPHYYRLVGDRYVVAFTNEMVASLQKARHVAVNSMSPVSLCSSDNGRDCTQTPWSNGYIAFFDAGQTGIVDGNDRIVHVVQPRKTPIRVVLNGADYVRFLGNGSALADMSSLRAYPQPASQLVAPTVLTRLLNAFSPVSLAHAAVTIEPASAQDNQSVVFLVCGGQIGRTIRVTPIGRLDTNSVACS
jgi:type IV fimbrial biogenesis protein FimT